MEKLLLSLGSIALGLVLGQAIRRLEVRRQGRRDVSTPKYIAVLRNISLLALNPVIIAGVFWSVKLNDMRLASLPVLGLAALVMGGCLGILVSRIMKHDRKKTGAMFTSGSFTNLGTFGGIICFAFFGESSLAYVYMYKFFEEMYYFAAGYPIAKTFGIDKGEKGKVSFLKAFADPFILLPLIGVALGLGLGFSGIGRPVFYAGLNSVLIPVMTVTLVTAVGYSMRFSKIRDYLKECIAVSAIKFIITPAVIIAAACLLGLPELENGLIFKIVVVMSMLPPAFNSLIPPQLYGLDTDLANSCWLVGTGMLGIIAPLLLVVL
jgi:predicted permease